MRNDFKSRQLGRASLIGGDWAYGLLLSGFSMNHERIIIDCEKVHVGFEIELGAGRASPEHLGMAGLCCISCADCLG